MIPSTSIVPTWRLGKSEAFGVPAAVLSAGFISSACSSATRAHGWLGLRSCAARSADRRCTGWIRNGAYFATRRNLFLGVGAGVATLIAFGYLRGV
jgi:hypothetical protein